MCADLVLTGVRMGDVRRHCASEYHVLAAFLSPLTSSVAVLLLVSRRLPCWEKHEVLHTVIDLFSWMQSEAAGLPTTVQPTRTSSLTRSSHERSLLGLRRYGYSTAGSVHFGSATSDAEGQLELFADSVLRDGRPTAADG